MRKQILVSLVLAVGFGCAATSSGAKTEHSVTLPRKVHFVGEKGTVVEADAGSYRLVDEGDARLRLVPAEGETLILPTVVTRHGKPEEKSSRAVSESVKKDLHRVALLLPGGVAFEAWGTYSGVRLRGDETLLSGGPRPGAEMLNPLTPRNKLVTVSSFSFVSISGSLFYNGIYLMVGGNTGTTQYAVAPVDLPHGAKLERLILVAHDIDLYNDLTCSLMRAAAAGTDLSARQRHRFVSVSSSGAPGHLVAATNMDHLVDRGKYFYYVLAEIVDTADTDLAQVRVEYSMPQ